MSGYQSISFQKAAKQNGKLGVKHGMMGASFGMKGKFGGTSGGRPTKRLTEAKRELCYYGFDIGEHNEIFEYLACSPKEYIYPCRMTGGSRKANLKDNRRKTCLRRSFKSKCSRFKKSWGVVCVGQFV